MTDLTLIIGDRSSGKSMLATYMAAQMRVAECAYIGESERWFGRRLAAARMNGPKGETSGSIKICDDFPYASYYRRIAESGAEATHTFVQSLLGAQHREAILVLRSDSLLAANTTRAKTELWAQADTVLLIERAGDGLRRVMAVKSRDVCRWAGLYRMGVEMVDGTSTSFLTRNEDENDCA